MNGSIIQIGTRITKQEFAQFLKDQFNNSAIEIYSWYHDYTTARVLRLHTMYEYQLQEIKKKFQDRWGWYDIKISQNKHTIPNTKVNAYEVLIIGYRNQHTTTR